MIPEVYFILLSTAELLDDLLDEVYAGAWVAVLYITTDDVLTTREDAVIGVGVEAHDLVLIYIGEVYRHMLIDEVDLLKGHLTRGDFEKRTRCAPSAEAIFTK